MTDALPADMISPNTANNRYEEREGFFSNFLQEALGIMHITGRAMANIEAPSGQSNSRDLGSNNLVPEISISNQNAEPPLNGGDGPEQAVSNPHIDPYGYGGDRKEVPLSNQDIDPYDYGGDTNKQQDLPPFSAESGPETPEHPPEAPAQPNPPADTPEHGGKTADGSGKDKPPVGDQQVKMGDRMFTVHTDGSAEYNVVKGDCVWFVAIDVLKGRTGKSPDDASIVHEVNEIAAASGLTQNGRNPDLIYPGDKLVIPAQKRS